MTQTREILSIKKAAKSSAVTESFAAEFIITVPEFLFRFLDK